MKWLKDKRGYGWVQGDRLHTAMILISTEGNTHTTMLLISTHSSSWSRDFNQQWWHMERTTHKQRRARSEQRAIAQDIPCCFSVVWGGHWQWNWQQHIRNIQLPMMNAFIFSRRKYVFFCISLYLGEFSDIHQSKKAATFSSEFQQKLWQQIKVNYSCWMQTFLIVKNKR